jgi:hypothetical protein
MASKPSGCWRAKFASRTIFASTTTCLEIVKIGARALRIRLGRVLEMAESSPDKFAYEKKIVERFGGQQEFELVVPPPLEMKEAAN